MTQENPITLDDIIKMDDVKDELKTQDTTTSLILPVKQKKSVNPAKTTSQKSEPVDGPKNITSPTEPKEAPEEILVEVKNISEDIKVKEDDKQRIFERVCTSCNHIFFSDIPIKYFYVDGKKGENYKVIKLPIKQYPTNMPEDILKMIESHECPKCRK